MATIEEQSYDTTLSADGTTTGGGGTNSITNTNNNSTTISPLSNDHYAVQERNHHIMIHNTANTNTNASYNSNNSNNSSSSRMNHHHHQQQQQLLLPFTATTTSGDRNNNNTNQVEQNPYPKTTTTSSSTLQNHPLQQQQQSQQQQQLQNHQHPQHPKSSQQQQQVVTNTPWTLGSTNGTSAFYLEQLQLQQQQQQQQEIVTTPNNTESVLLPHNTNDNSGTGAVTSLLLSANNNNNSIQKKSTHSTTTSISTIPTIQPQTPTSPAAADVIIPILSTTATTTTTTIIPTSTVEESHAFTTGAMISSNTGEATIEQQQIQIQQLQQQQVHNNNRSLYHDRLIYQSSEMVEAVLSAACDVMGFDIAEMWLRTGLKTHQLTNSHLRPTALEDSVRKDLVDVYYGEKSSERTHRLSPALCKRAKEAGDVVWITAHNRSNADVLRCSISNVRTAVAVPVCHESSNTNITIIFFSIRRIIVRPTSVEFLVHMSLAAGVASVNSLAQEGHESRADTTNHKMFDHNGGNRTKSPTNNTTKLTSRSEHGPITTTTTTTNRHNGEKSSASLLVRNQQRTTEKVSVTGASLDVQWRQLANVEYLTDGGNSWIHTAVYNGKPVVIKTLKPECQDVVLAINEIETELAIHSKLNHTNIVSLVGAGTTSKGVRFFVLERLDGGTLTQRLGYDTRIRDRRKRFWRKKVFPYLDVLRIAKSIAEAMAYCHESAIPGCVVLHRDLKPDNIGFTLDGTVKIIDFGLAKIIENVSIESDDVYAMSGETGSLRYMSPEVAAGEPYNYSADVYSFGIILWEMNATKKPFEGLSRDLFYERVVHGGERPSISRKWPIELSSLMTECWDADLHNRPRFRDIVTRIDKLLDKEKGGNDSAIKKTFLPKITGMIDRHSTWF